MLNQAASGESNAAVPDPDSRDLESRIGLYWLNRLGVGALVIGVALLLTMSFLQLAPFLKLLAGFAVAALLIGSGEAVIRRSTYKWYGQGLIGGGWSLAFFIAYAGHHLEAIKVIANPAADVVLLLAIAAASMFHAARRRSQTIAVLASLLGFITISLTPVGMFSAIASALLNLVLCILAVVMRWHVLLVIGALSSYGLYFLSHANPLVLFQTSLSLKVTSTYLVSYWLAYTGSVLFMNEHDTPSRRALVAVTITSGLACIFGMLMAIYDPATQTAFLFGSGIIYALSLAGSTRTYLPTVSSIHTLLAVSLITLGISQKLAYDWLTPFWLIEIGLLALVGLRHGIKEFRWFALAISPLVFLFMLTNSLFNSTAVQIGTLLVNLKLIYASAGATTFSAAAALHYLFPSPASQGPNERTFAFYMYVFLASMMWCVFPLTGFYTDWQAPVWSITALAIYSIGVRIDNPFVRISGLMNLLWCICSLFTLVPGWHWLPTLMVASAVALMGRNYNTRSDGRLAFTAAAVGIITFLMAFRLLDNWYSLFLTLEGFLLVLSGFYLDFKLVRALGLMTFGLLALRLVFIDLSAADSIGKVLTFVAGGCVLLVASWIYAGLLGKKNSIASASDNSDKKLILNNADGEIITSAETVSNLTM